MNIKLKSVSKFFKKNLAASLVALGILLALFAYVGVSLFLDRSKAADYGPITAQDTSAALLDSGGNRATDYGSSVTMSGGQGVRIRDSVRINSNADVTFYSNYGRDGAFSWAQASGHDRMGGGTVSFNLPSGKSLEYVKGSTYYQECNTSTNVCDSGQTIADDQWGETPLFQDLTRSLTYKADYRYDYYYDLKVVNQPAPAFNTHSTDQPTFQVRDVTRGGSFTTNVSRVTPGDELEFYFYVHNNPRGSVATNVRVGVDNWTSGPSGSYSVTGFVNTDNAPKVTGTVHITLTTPAGLQFESGSGNWSGWSTVLGSKFTNANLGDAIITTGGVQIGDHGVQDGCWDFLSKAYFKARVPVVSTPTPTVTPTPTYTPTPTATPNYCNGTCGSNINCQGGLFCYQGFCRNPENPIDLNCSGPTPTPTAPPVLGATAPPVLPKTGGDGLEVAASLTALGMLGVFVFKKFKLI